MNAARKSARLAALNTDNAAASKAQGWAQHMAGTGVLEHTGGGSKVSSTGLSNWCSLGENVGYGPSVQRIHDAFMASAAHKAHIVGRFDRLPQRQPDPDDRPHQLLTSRPRSPCAVGRR